MTQPTSGAATTIIFAGTQGLGNPNQNIANPFTLNQLIFDSSAGEFKLDGFGLNFVSNGSTLPAVTQNSFSAQTIGQALILGNNLTVGGIGPGGLTLTGPVTGAGSLTMNGGYTLTLAGAGSSFSGGLFVNNGTVRLGANNVLTAASPDVTVGGGTFNLNGFNQTLGSLAFGPSTTANPTVTTGAGTLTLGGNVAFTGGTSTRAGLINGNLNLGGASRTFTISSNSSQAYDLVVSAAIGGSGGLVQDGVGSGNLVLNAVNTYTGPTTVNNGTLWLGSVNALPSNTAVNLTSANAQLRLNPTNTALGVTAGSYNQTIRSLSGVAGSQVLLGAATLTVGNFSSSTDTTFAGNLIGGTLVKTGSGFLTLSGTGNTANIEITGGLLQGLHVDSVTGGASGFGALGSGGLTLRAGNLSYGGPTASTAKPITLFSSLNAIEVLNQGTTLTLTTAFNAAPFAGLQVRGAGVLELRAANIYDGGTIFHSGTVLASADNVLGASSNQLFFENGVLRFGAAFNPAATYRISMNALGAGGFDTNGFDVTVAQSITGGGTLNKYGAGTLTLSGAASKYSGGTTVHGGTLKLGTGTALPTGGDVTVQNGATLNTDGLFNTPATAIGALTLDGGTLRIPTGTNAYFRLNKLVANTGGVVDTTGTSGGGGVGAGLAFSGSGAGITVNATTTWTGPADSFLGNNLGTEMPITIAPGVTLTSGLSLASFVPSASNPILVTGGGTLALTNPAFYLATVRVSGATLQMADLTKVTPTVFDLTLDNGTFRYSSGTASAVGEFSLGTGGGTIDVSNAATTLTFTGAVASGGLLTKTGPGVLVLNNLANHYVGGIAVSGGRLDVGADAQLGVANPTVNAAGTLRYTASATTARTFNLNGGTLEVPAGVTLTLNGAAVNGGFLRGSGTYNLTGGTTLSGATTFNSTTLNQTGPATLFNVTHGGTLTNAAGQSLTWNGGTVAASGVVAVNGTVNATDFSSIGRINVNPGGTFNNTASTLVFGGGSVTNIGNYNPANQQVPPGGTLNFGSGDLRVQGGFVRNNGTIAGTGNLIIDFGGVVRGAGEIDTPSAPIRINGGQLLAGNSPGLSRVTNFSLVSTGVTGGDLSNAAGIAGPPIGSSGTQLSGWSVFEYGNSTNTGGSAQIEGTPASKAIWQFRTVIDGGDYNTPGTPANFDPAQSYTWGIVRPRSAATADDPDNVTPINTVAELTIFDTALGATVPLTDANLNAYLRFDDSAWNWGGIPVALRGTFGFVLLSDELGVPNRVIAVTYAPVPEPALVLGAIVVGLFGLRVRRIIVVSWLHRVSAVS